MTWLKLAWTYLGWRGTAALAGLLAAAGMGILLLITSARLDAARADLRQQQAECAAQIAALEMRLATAQVQAERLQASAEALAGQVRAAEAARARERQRQRQARAALAHVKPVPLIQAEATHAVVDLESSGRVAAVLNAVFAGLRGPDGTGPGPAAAPSGLPQPGPAGPDIPGPVRAPGQRQ